MRATERVWVNSKGDIYWASSFYMNAMPCNTKLEQQEVKILSELVQKLPRQPYERGVNSNCKDRLNFFIIVATEVADDSF